MGHVHEGASIDEDPWASTPDPHRSEVEDEAHEFDLQTLLQGAMR